MEWELIKTLAALVGCILGILSFYEKIWGATADLKSKVLVLEGRTTDPEVLERITALETRVGPFWRVLEENLVEFLRRPTHLEMDKLLDEYKEKHGDLSLDELNLLKYHLLTVIEDFKAQKRARELEDSGKGCRLRLHAGNCRVEDLRERGARRLPERPEPGRDQGIPWVIN